MKKRLKTAGIVLVVALLLLQFYRPGRNSSNDNTYAINTKFAVPDSVETILKASCYDCHSNNTVYPWYAEIQPVRLWLDNHIREGKQHLNFSTFAGYRPNRQLHAMKDLAQTIKEGEMPISSYTLIHTYAKLSPEQKDKLITWAQVVSDSLKANNPPDSLIWKRQKRRD